MKTGDLSGGISQYLFTMDFIFDILKNVAGALWRWFIELMRQLMRKTCLLPTALKQSNTGKVKIWAEALYLKLVGISRGESPPLRTSSSSQAVLGQQVQCCHGGHELWFWPAFFLMAFCRGSSLYLSTSWSWLSSICLFSRRAAPPEFYSHLSENEPLWWRRSTGCLWVCCVRELLRDEDRNIHI